MNKRVAGTTLVEYGIVGALIMVALIASVMVVGKDLNGIFGMVYKDMGKNITAAGGHVDPLPTQSVAGGAGINNIIPPPGTHEEQICYGNGMCVNIPLGEAARVQTLAGNGGDRTLANARVLRQIAEQLRAEDPNSPLADLIEELANEGHEMGAGEQALAGFCPAGDTCGAASVDGQLSEVSISEATTRLNDMLSGLTGNQAEFNSLHTEINQYLANHPQALPPELASLVNHEAGEINTIANAIDNHTSTDQIRADEYRTVSYEVDEGAELTRSDSNTICAVSGGSCHRSNYHP